MVKVKEEAQENIEMDAAVEEAVEKTIGILENDEMSQLQAQVEEKQRLADEYLDRCKRLQADFDNLRRRSRQEKEELSQVITQNILLEMLPVVDNFERALGTGAAEDAATLLQGVGMINRQLLQVMEKCGLTQVESVGQMFDPQKHEAIMRVEDPEQTDGLIVEELQKGYMVRGKVIRPSMVKVVSN